MFRQRSSLKIILQEHQIRRMLRVPKSLECQKVPVKFSGISVNICLECQKVPVKFNGISVNISPLLLKGDIRY